jgi:hypothetical protein
MPVRCMCGRQGISIDHLPVAWKARLTATSEAQRRRTGFLRRRRVQLAGWAATGRPFLACV